MNETACPAALTLLQAVDWGARKLDGRTNPGSRVESELLLGKACASSRLELYLDHGRRLDYWNLPGFRR